LIGNRKKLLEISDERGKLHTVTERNLRAYKGRIFRCGQDHDIVIDEAPLLCECGASPKILLVGPSDWWNQPNLEEANVLLIGCGAIGNEVAKNLVLLGIGQLTIIDFDVIEGHNLSRTVLFNKHSMANTFSADESGNQYKVDVMKNALLALNPDVQVEAIVAGVTDWISVRNQKHKKWPNTIEGSELMEMAKKHVLCVIATDGVAPKAYVSQHVYPYIPVVQAAMNHMGNTISVRVSLPYTTGCVMCPTAIDPVPVSEDGDPSPYLKMMNQKTGSNPCDIAAQAAGAASFADANAVAGSFASSQCIILLMGWGEYRSSNGEWPKGMPTPLWDEALIAHPRNPSMNKIVPLLNKKDQFGEFICSNFCNYSDSGINVMNEELLVKSMSSARNSSGQGVERPYSQKRKLGN